MLGIDYKQQRPWLSVEDLKKMTCASELFLWSGSCPSSTTNHLKREESNPHKSKQLYWLSRMIYLRMRDLDSKNHQQLGNEWKCSTKPISHTIFSIPKIQSGSINTTVTSFRCNFGLFSRRAWCSCYSPHLSTWAWGQVKDNQQDDVMFVEIKMVAMVGKSSIENETLGGLSWDNLINHRVWCERSVDYIVCWLIIMRWTHAVFLKATSNAPNIRFYRQQMRFEFACVYLPLSI